MNAWALLNGMPKACSSRISATMLTSLSNADFHAGGSAQQFS